jgi:hypothetical protein
MRWPDVRWTAMRAFVLLFAFCLVSHAETVVSIQGEDFHLNGKPTYAGREWQGHRIEGLLMNSRMVQGTFDDRNAQTVKNWAYPDTKKWDAERNTLEFIAAMPEWRAHGLLAFTLNLQGGSPYGYSKDQPWHNSAINDDGTLRGDYLARAEKIITKADELGMVVILGIFYFGQDQRLKDEQAVIAAVDGVTRWILAKKWRHVLVEVNNEANVKYDHDILKPQRVHELIQRVKAAGLPAGTSFGGGAVPTADVIAHSDFLLIHGNGVKGPDAMRQFIAKVKKARGDRNIPIVINEDDHFEFDQADNNFTAAVKEHVSWGFFDFRMKGEGFDDGYQSVPVNWGLSSPRKRGFFELMKQLTGF